MSFMMLWVRNSERARLDDSSLVSLAAAGPAGSTQIWFLHSHLGPWCCLALSLSPAPHLLGLLCAAGASHGPCSQGSRTPVLALLVQAKPGAHPRHLAGKSSRGPVYIHREGKENPFPHGRGVKVFTAFFSSPCLAYFLSSFSFWGLLRIQWSL